MKGLLTAKEVAKLLRLSRKTVYKLARSGDLPGVKVGAQWRFSSKAVKRWGNGSA